MERMRFRDEDVFSEEEINRFKSVDEQNEKINDVAKALLGGKKCRYCGGKFYSNNMCVNCYSKVIRGRSPIAQYYTTSSGKKVKCYKVNKKALWAEILSSKIGAEYALDEPTLIGAIDTLEDDCRELLHGLYVEGMSIGRYASMHGITSGEVKGIDERAIRALRKELKG